MSGIREEPRLTRLNEAVDVEIGIAIVMAVLFYSIRWGGELGLFSTVTSSTSAMTAQLHNRRTTIRQLYM